MENRTWEDRLELLQGVLKLWHVHVRGEAYSVSASLDELLESDIHVATTQELEHHQYSEHCFPADPRVTPEVPGILSFAQCRRVSVLLCLGLSGNGTLQYGCGFSRSMSCLDSYPPCCLWS